jgi:hypothetical protein
MRIEGTDPKAGIVEERIRLKNEKGTEVKIQSVSAIGRRTTGGQRAVRRIVVPGITGVEAGKDLTGNEAEIGIVIVKGIEKGNKSS